MSLLATHETAFTGATRTIAESPVVLLRAKHLDHDPATLLLVRLSRFRPIDDGGRHRVFLSQDTTLVKCNADGSECDWRWNKANVQSVGGGVVVPNGGPMRFYVGGRTGVDQLVGNATAGFAELRRDVSDGTAG